MLFACMVHTKLSYTDPTLSLLSQESFLDLKWVSYQNKNKVVNGLVPVTVTGLSVKLR